ncbi:UPF0481 protein At3g47200-like [Magnolia sinica]|uniref:UPF0481 protein At3g47200-like n=1 Tax=Magnolia sinica TaxID=86752 RepID=UPI00265B5BE5|nr:UPF0481 protein At3g47200-like [Magnolia sinica]
MDDRQAAANSMMKSAASLKMDDDMIEIEEEANTPTNASPRLKAIADSMMNSMMKLVNASVSKLRNGDPPTIYKVPQKIRQEKEVAYEPQIVSIGPYHNGKEKLQAMEEHKWLYLHSFLSRNTKYKLEHYLKAMSEWEDEARSCYYDNVDLQVGNEFVKMMVLDACFIVEIFLMFHPIEQWEELKQNEEDLGLLSAMDQEFFFHSNGFEDPIRHAIGKVYYPSNKEIKINEYSYYHLLHLFHSHLLPTPTNSKEEPNLSCNPKIKSVLNKLKNLIIFLPCSNKAPTDLQLAGVKFKKNEKSNNILNVKFSHGVLEITPFLIQDDSETLFRNLVAFEQCCLHVKFHFFTTFFFFMDFLVNTSKDVALLHQNGIIDNYLGSDDDVALLFNRLCIGVFLNFNASYLSDVKDNVQKHCENKWNMWQASLKRDYFTNPWSFISLIAASILLLLTITQTFFTVFPHYGPQS